MITVNGCPACLGLATVADRLERACVSRGDLKQSHVKTMNTLTFESSATLIDEPGLSFPARGNTLALDAESDYTEAAQHVSANDELEDENELSSVDTEAVTLEEDPVRLYLNQIGRIPLLTRSEEIAVCASIP